MFRDSKRIREPGEAASLAVEITDHALKVEVLRKIAAGGGTRARAFTDIINSESTLTSEERLHILKP
jgi:hypothetical protein